MLHKILILIAAGAFMLTACGTTGTKSTGPKKKDYSDFLKPNEKAEELFRVLLDSDEYKVVQMKYDQKIKRNDDPGGDRYMCEEIKKLDKIDEEREGILSIWLLPDTGRITKVRPQKPTYIIEVDQLLTDDIQRWNFTFPNKVVEPTKFDIKYKIVLRKKQTDEEIMKEIRQKMKDSSR